MKPLSRRSGSMLFLTELLVSLLILAVTAAVCVGLFSSARAMRQKSAALTKAVALAENAAEAFCGRRLNDFLSLPEGETAENTRFTLYYDASGNKTEPSSAAYCLHIFVKDENGMSAAEIKVNSPRGEELFSLRAEALEEARP